mgnify:CR=1 FL=1
MVLAAYTKGFMDGRISEYTEVREHLEKFEKKVDSGFEKTKEAVQKREAEMRENIKRELKELVEEVWLEKLLAEQIKGDESQ